MFSGNVSGYILQLKLYIFLWIWHICQQFLICLPFKRSFIFFFFFSLVMSVSLNKYHKKLGFFNNQNVKISKVKSHYSSILSKNFDGLFALFLFSTIVIKTFNFKYILNLIDLGTVKTNKKDSHTLLFRILHLFIYVIIYLFIFIRCVYHVLVYNLLFTHIGDIEQNLGPKSNSCEFLSICPWSLFNLTLRSHIKIALLGAYTSLNRFDVL